VARGIDVIRVKFQRRGLGADRTKRPKQIIDVIEYVEEFRAEFETLILADGKLFHQRSIPGLYPGPICRWWASTEGSLVELFRNAQVLNNVPGMHGLALGLPTRLGRAHWKPTVPAAVGIGTETRTSVGCSNCR